MDRRAGTSSNTRTVNIIIIIISSPSHDSPPPNAPPPPPTRCHTLTRALVWLRIMGSKVYLLVLLAACVLPGQSALMGSRKCTYGPSYWCSSLKSASECSAVKHCIQTVWEKQRLPEDNDDICDLCKSMVLEARDQLLSNETQEDIRAVFEGSCRLIPIKVVSDECVHVADDFIPELIDTLASQMNPQVVCATAGLCNSVAVDMFIQIYKNDHPLEKNIIIAPQQARRPQPPQNLQPLQPLQHPQPGDCEACKDFVSRTIRLVKTHSRAELMDRLLAICGRLGSLSDGCMALVEVNFNDIYTFLTQQLTPDAFCDLVEMCETRMHDSEFYQRPPLRHTGDEACDFCEAIVQHWRDVLTANTTEQEFKEILVGICHHTGKFSKNCIALVEEYYQPLYNLLMSEFQPKSVCESVGLCGVNSVFAKQPPVWTLLSAGDMNTVPQTEPLPAIPEGHQAGHRMTGDDEAAAINFENQEPHLPSVPLSHNGISVVLVGKNGEVGPTASKSSLGGDGCVMCEFALQFLRKMLEQKDTREDIEHAVENLCSLMPHTVSEECEDYVEAYGDQVIELLAQEIDPSQICQMIGVCPQKPESVSAKEDVTCVMCEYAMTQLKEILGDHKTEEDIRHALDSLCSVLPKTVEKECQVFVDTYTEQIINLLINGVTAEQICVELHLCHPKAPQLPELNGSNQLPISRLFSASSVPESNSISHSSGRELQSTVCVLCEFVLHEVDHYLLQNSTESGIIEVVDFVCAHLPSTIQDNCISFVDLYGASIIELLVQELNPKEVCQGLKLCKGPKFSGMRAVLKMDKCQVCEALVTRLDSYLKDEQTQVAIDDLLEEVCRMLPWNTTRDCRGIVEVYGPYLANLLAEVLVPKKVCEEVHLCPRTPENTLLGGQKCTWGPSYWCQTQIHAAACSATAHCKQTVWKTNTPLI